MTRMRHVDASLSSILRPRLVSAGRSAPCNIAVIPAEAGIQALNGIARLARDLKSYLWVTDPRESNVACAARTIERLIAGGSAPAPWMTFSCLSKRKSPKRKTPGRFAAHTSRGSLRASLRPGARLTRRALNNAPRARSGVSRRLPAWLGARLAPTGILKTHPHNIPPQNGTVGFSGPRSARRVPQPHREQLSEPVFEPAARKCMARRARAASRATFSRPASWRAPGGARNVGSSRALRGVLSLVSFFARAKKETRPRCGEPHLIRRRRRLDLRTLLPLETI